MEIVDACFFPAVALLVDRNLSATEEGGRGAFQGLRLPKNVLNKWRPPLKGRKRQENLPVVVNRSEQERFKELLRALLITENGVALETLCRLFVLLKLAIVVENNRAALPITGNRREDTNGVCEAIFLRVLQRVVGPLLRRQVLDGLREGVIDHLLLFH